MTVTTPAKTLKESVITTKSRYDDAVNVPWKDIIHALRHDVESSLRCCDRWMDDVLDDVNHNYPGALIEDKHHLFYECERLFKTHQLFMAVRRFLRLPALETIESRVIPYKRFYAESDISLLGGAANG